MKETTNEQEVKKASFQEVYEEFYDSMVSFAESYVGRREVAEDIVQEIFAGMWEKELRFLSHAALNTYLYTSVKNASLDYLKHREVEARHAEHYAANVKMSHWETKLDNEMMKALFQAIDQLPERCREIFLLHLDGLSNDEIAIRLGLSVETVKTQKKKAMRILRDYFNDPSHRPSLSCYIGLMLLLNL